MAGNPLTENARSGILMITTMSIATNRTVSGALCHDKTMGKPDGMKAEAREKREMGWMEGWKG